MNNKGEVTRLFQDEETYSQVYHLKIQGANSYIGEFIGEHIKANHSFTPPKVKNPLVYKTQLEYISNIYPEFSERINGFSKVFNKTTTNIDCSYFGFALGETLCSAVYYPPCCTNDNKGVLSRNLDFSVNFLNEKAPFKKVYIQELHPENCYSSLSVVCYEVFGQALEGINSEGLSVVHLADGESAKKYPEYGSKEAKVGFNEFLPIQYLLDNCATIDEAKKALLTMKHYYHAVPVHLLITDISGESFIWERTPWGNTEIIIDNKSKPQVITNFLIHKYNTDKSLPINREDPNCEFLRYTKLRDALKGRNLFNWDEIEGINSKVYFKPSQNKDGLFADSGRTILHSFYIPDDRKLKIKFYKNDGENNSIIFSNFLEFTLKNSM